MEKKRIILKNHNNPTRNLVYTVMEFEIVKYNDVAFIKFFDNVKQETKEYPYESIIEIVEVKSE